MITCKNCETAQFLQIVKSRVYFEDGIYPEEIKEVFECTMCNAEGKLEVWEENGTRRTRITGDIEETDDRPEVSR